MKISKLAFDTNWEGYLRAMEKFGIIELYAWQDIPLNRVEFVIRTNHNE